MKCKKCKKPILEDDYLDIPKDRQKESFCNCIKNIKEVK
jgi:hypothetical protein